MRPRVEKEEQYKPEARKRKKIIRIGTTINEIENRITASVNEIKNLINLKSG